ncbi:MAG: carbohydrate-binding protein [Lachnospiraceae bacterium]|nr:carbohydrate-binding protein [Lachnospiraceae bacterium]
MKTHWKLLITLLLAGMVFTMVPGVPDPVSAAVSDDTSGYFVSGDPVVWTCYNLSGVSSWPEMTTKFTIDEACHISSIMTYHWNNGKGEEPGKISLRKDRTVIGTWDAEGYDGMGEVKNANWVAAVDLDLEPGTYQVLDSDTETWSFNGGSEGMGFAELRGVVKNGSKEDPAGYFVTDDPILWTCYNLCGVGNYPDEATKFTLDEACHVTYIMDYHWNNGKGKKPGEISLKKDGRIIGTWDAEGYDGMGHVKNANWVAPADIDLEPGEYEVIDSDDETWSHNSSSGKRGFVQIYGYSEGDGSGSYDDFDFSSYDNLLVNGDAEKGSIKGWETEGADWEAAETVSGVEPHAGSYFFWPTQTEGGYLIQDVDISKAKTGDVFVAGAYMRDYVDGHGDESELIIQLLDSKEKVLEEAKTETITQTEEWTKKVVSLKKTDSARYIRVLLHATRNVGSDCDSYFDDVVLVNAGENGAVKPGKNGGKDKGGTLPKKIQGEDFDEKLSDGVAGASEGENGNLGYIVDGGYAGYPDIDFGNGADTFVMHASKPNALAYTMEIRLDSPKGTLIGKYDSPESEKTDSWSDFVDIEVPISKSPTGVHDLYFVFKSDSSSYLMDIDYFGFR